MKNRAKVLLILLAIIPVIASSLAVATLAPSSNVVFAVGPHAGYTVVPAALTQTAGTPFQITITAVDAEGITVTGIDETLSGYTFTFSGPANAPSGTTPTYPSSLVFINGVCTPPITLVKAETVALTVTDNQDPSMSGTSDLITVNPEEAASFNVVTQNGDTETAGVAFNVTLTALDEYGNTATSYSGPKDITFTFTATNAPDDTAPTIPASENITFTNGTGNSSSGGFILVNAGETPTITATAGAISGTSDAITVNPAAIDHYTVTSASYSQTVDVAFTVTVTAYDEYDNVATNAGPVRVCMSSNPAIIVFNAEGNEDFSDTKDTDICDTLSNGAFNIPAKAITTSIGVTITAEDAGDKTGTSDPYIISAADGNGTPTPTPTPTATPTGPTIAFIPSSFNFMATEGGDNPASKTLSIWNSGTGTLTWSLADNADWLTLSPTGGSSTGVTDKDSVTLSVDISGMSAGSNSATITISASGATNTPRTVTVTLTILTPQTPTNTVGTAESWVEGLDGKVILHFRAGSFASETNVSIALKTIHGDAPEDFTLGETCFSITAEAELLRSIDVCVRYTDADVAAADGDPGKLRLAVYDETEGEWDVLSTSIDERTRTACARVKHLSDFAILAGPGPPGFFSADWWTVWWHITPIAVGLVIVIAVAIWLWSRYKYYY